MPNKPEQPTMFDTIRNRLEYERTKLFAEIEAKRNQIAGIEQAITVVDYCERDARVVGKMKEGIIE